MHTHSGDGGSTTFLPVISGLCASECLACLNAGKVRIPLPLCSLLPLINAISFTANTAELSLLLFKNQTLFTKKKFEGFFNAVCNLQKKAIE